MSVKRFVILLLAFAILASAPAFSKDRVAVLDFEAKNVEENEAMAIADLFRSDLVATGVYIVLERGNMQSILNEYELQSSGLIDETSATEIGKLLAVNYLFIGNLSKFGNKYLIVIDKINVNTGEIELSIKKSAINIDDFIDLSTEAAEELTGEQVASTVNEGAAGYSPETITEYVNSIGFFSIMDFKKIDFNTKTMQTSDLDYRRKTHSENELDNAIVAMLVNAVTFGIGGSFMQGFNEYGYLSIGTTALFITTLAIGDATAMAMAGVLYGASYIGSYITPYWYEGAYNQQLKDTLLIY